MRIDSTGNVGIGTPSPSAKTHIVGSDILYGENSADAVNRPTISLGWNSTTQARLGLTYFSGAPTLGWSLETRNAGASVAAVTITGAGSVGIGTPSPAASAKLDIDGTTGALLVPRLTTTERNALTAVNGMIIYNTTDNQMQGRINGAWAAM